jgi:hypothetical protein
MMQSKVKLLIGNFQSAIRRFHGCGGFEGRRCTVARTTNDGAIPNASRHWDELRRPEADYLQDGIYELRVGFQHVNYRMLYFFYKNIAVVRFVPA